MKYLRFGQRLLVALFILLQPDLAQRSLSTSAGDRQPPVYRLQFEVCYTDQNVSSEVTSSTVSNVCGEKYATTFLTSFVQLNSWLDTLCADVVVQIDNRAVVYIHGREVRVETAMTLSLPRHNLQGDNVSIILCSKKINETLQDVARLDRRLRNISNQSSTISSIEQITATECNPATMHPLRFKLMNMNWTCNANYYFYKERWECYRDGFNAFTTRIVGGATMSIKHRTTTTSSSVHVTASSHVNSDSSGGFHTSVFPVTSPPETTIELDGPEIKYWGIEALKNVSRIHLTEGSRVFKLPVRMWYNETAICQGEFMCTISMIVSFKTREDHPELECRRTGQSIPQVALSRPLQMPWASEENFCRLRFPSNQTVVDGAHLLLQAVIDHKYDGMQTRWLQLSLVRQTPLSQRSEMLLEIPVLIEDIDKKATCQSINDPHITTFDGFEYNNFYEGEFILYRHRTLPFSVHAIYQKCQPNLPASCNCGVAVQSGDDVIVIDRCFRRRLPVPAFRSRWTSDSSPAMKVQLMLNGNLTQGTKIHEDADGKKYFIYLPHGAYVKIMTSGQLVNLWIVPSPNDFYMTEGLCGVYDWNRDNDINFRKGSGTTLESMEEMNFTEDGRPQPAAFIRDWSVDMGTKESLFRGVAPALKPYVPGRYCICSEDGDTAFCDYAADVSRCDIYQGRDVTSWLVSRAIPSSISSRTKRRASRDINDNSVHTGLGTENEPIIYDKKFVPPLKYKWRNSWNEVDATNYCRRHIKDNYSIGQLCAQIPPVNFKQEITTCVEDIKITGNTSWADSARDAMKEQCIEEVQKNGSLPLDIVRRISSEMCINDCSGHGVCQNGTCKCDVDYGSADCSTSLRNQPYVNDMPRYGLCDVRFMNCNRAIVYGGNFMDSINLTCHLQKCKMTDRTYEPLDVTVMLKATFINYNAVECPIPSVHVYLIRISNNGVNTSEALLFIPFDSACNSCNVLNTTCLKRRNSCIIDGRCYREGELSPADGCLICKAYDEEFQWTTVTDGSCYRAWWESFHLPDWAVALGAAVGGSLIGVLTGFLLYRCCCRSKKLPADDDLAPTGRMDVGDCSGFETESFLHRSRIIPTFNGDPFSDLDPFDADLEGPAASVFYNDGKGVENGVDSTTYF